MDTSGGGWRGSEREFRSGDQHGYAHDRADKGGDFGAAGVFAINVLPGARGFDDER